MLPFYTTQNISKAGGSTPLRTYARLGEDDKVLSTVLRADSTIETRGREIESRKREKDKEMHMYHARLAHRLSHIYTTHNNVHTRTNTRTRTEV